MMERKCCARAPRLGAMQCPKQSPEGCRNRVCHGSPDECELVGAEESFPRRFIGFLEPLLPELHDTRHATGSIGPAEARSQARHCGGAARQQ